MADVSVDVWGAATWRALHSIAHGYDLRHRHGLLSDQDRRDAKSFVLSLRTLLPCSSCRAGFSDILDQQAVTAALDHAIARGEFFAWTVHLHIAVDAKIKPHRKPMTIEEARRLLLQPRASGDADQIAPIPWGAVWMGGGVALGCVFLWWAARIKQRARG
jgi:hypothetical protein